MSCFSFILPLLCFNFSTMPPKRARAAATTPQAKKSRRLASKRGQSAERPPNTHSDNATQHKEPVVADHASPVTLDNVVTNIADSLSRSMAESIQTAVTAGILAAMQSLPAQGSNAQRRTDNEHSRTDAEDAASLVEVSAMQPRQVAHTEKAVADEINSAVTDILGSGEPLSSEPIRVRHDTLPRVLFAVLRYQ